MRRDRCQQGNCERLFCGPDRGGHAGYVQRLAGPFCRAKEVIDVFDSVKADNITIQKTLAPSNCGTATGVRRFQSHNGIIIEWSRDQESWSSNVPVRLGTAGITVWLIVWTAI
jgi:hypothetical protein